MLIWENIKIACKALFSNKLRALLTMLGIIIGIGSVIAIMTVSESLSASISKSFQKMGTNNITVGLSAKSEEEGVRADGMRFGAGISSWVFSYGTGGSYYYGGSILDGCGSIFWILSGKQGGKAGSHRSITI